MIYALHGFLGLASDWDFLAQANLQVQKENLWTDDVSLSMNDWAEKKSKDLNSVKSPRILLGYSMGGRLAMHLLLAQPRFWDAAIFVSANPGTSDIRERESRTKIDHDWAEKFLNEDWSKVLSDWNKQNLFSKTAAPLPRDEKDFDRKKLAVALENWSLAKQEDLTIRMSQVGVPVLWVAGEHDKKYCDLLSGFPHVALTHSFIKISNASHRVPWDNQAEFLSLVENFVAQIYNA